MEEYHYVKGHEDYYVKEITYSASLQQMIALIDNSNRCEQYIRLDCYDSAFKNGFIWNHWWQNRHGDEMHNWGSPKGTDGCDCSIGNSM